MQNNFRADFSIPKETLKKLATFSKKSLIKKSSLVAKLIEDFLNKPENKKFL